MALGHVKKPILTKPGASLKSGAAPLYFTLNSFDVVKRMYKLTLMLVAN